MVFKWLRLFVDIDCDESDKDKIVYSKDELTLSLQDKIMTYEVQCEQLCTKIQKEFSPYFSKKGLHNLVVKVCRTIDNDELDYLTAKYCFEEAYESEIVVDYAGDQELKQMNEDSYQAIIFIWSKWKRKAFFCGKTMEDMESELRMKMQEILDYVD